MRLSFFLNQMGVYSTRWYEYNNIPYIEVTRYNSILDEDITVKEYTTHYSMGRIDIAGVPNEPYGLEYGVGVMESESWCELGSYLRTLSLKHLPTKDELLGMFEEKTGKKIKWFVYI